MINHALRVEKSYRMKGVWGGALKSEFNFILLGRCRDKKEEEHEKGCEASI